MTSEHPYYEELAALAAGGYLGEEELSELQRHSETCAECRTAVAEFRELVHFGLPLTESRLHRLAGVTMSRPNPGATERFIQRASMEGITFSRGVNRLDASPRWHLRFAAPAVGLAAALLIAFIVGLRPSGHAPVQRSQENATQAQEQLEQLTRQNSSLDQTVSRLQQTLTEQQRETNDLRAQLASQNVAANTARHDKEQALSAATLSASHDAQSLQEAEAQQKTLEKQVADTEAQLARLDQARASDQADLVAAQAHINELSEQLKTATTNVDMERQLATAGKDVRDLMGARQLHVVDVRDTDPNGKAGKAFGRVFLTEGKSLIFYAFDLTDAKKMNAKQTFQVWGQQEGNATSLRSLGFLYVDDKTQRRWALKTDDPAAVKEIDSVFVTVEPEGGAKKPSSQRLLYAYLGDANHP
jgi:hypothetical protein